MSVDVPQLIVHVEEAPEAVLNRGHWPVARQDVFVKLEVFGGLGQIQQSRSLVEHHSDKPSHDTLHLLDSTSFLAIYILHQVPRLATGRHRGRGKLGTMVPVCMVGQVISPDVQPVALAKWHAFSLANELRVLIPKPVVILTNTHVHFGQLLLVKVHNLFTPQSEVHASVHVQFIFQEGGKVSL